MDIERSHPINRRGIAGEEKNRLKLRLSETDCERDTRRESKQRYVFLHLCLLKLLRAFTGPVVGQFLVKSVRYQSLVFYTYYTHWFRGVCRVFKISTIRNIWPTVQAAR